MANEQLQQLKALALAASPGPWKGDRIDGTVKYNLLDADDKPVISGDNGNSDHGPFGIHEEEDEKYLLAAHPAAILSLIAKVESLAAPSIASSAPADELPADPEPTIIGGRFYYTAAQMQAAIAAQQAAPAARLTDDAIRKLWQESYNVALKDAGFRIGNSDVAHMNQPIVFARAIEAAAAPNAALEKAFQAMLKHWAGPYFNGVTRGEAEEINETVAAALASLPVPPKEA